MLPKLMGKKFLLKCVIHGTFLFLTWWVCFFPWSFSYWGTHQFLRCYAKALIPFHKSYHLFICQLAIFQVFIFGKPVFFSLKNHNYYLTELCSYFIIKIPHFCAYIYFFYYENRVLSSRYISGKHRPGNEIFTQSLESCLMLSLPILSQMEPSNWYKMFCSALFFSQKLGHVPPLIFCTTFSSLWVCIIQFL